MNKLSKQEILKRLEIKVETLEDLEDAIKTMRLVIQDHINKNKEDVIYNIINKKSNTYRNLVHLVFELNDTIVDAIWKD